MIRGAVVVGVILGTLMLAGCAPAVRTADPSPRVTTAVPTHAPTTPPALSDLVLSPDGLGPLVIGSPVPEQGASSAIVIWDPSKCEPTGAWLANYPGETDEHGNADSAPFYFAVAKKSDPVNELVVVSPKIKTSAGVGVGSTQAQLKAAYPSLGAPVHGPVTDLYVESGTSGQLIFEVGVTGSWAPEQVGTVVLVQLETRTDAPSSVADNDASGICLPD